MGGWLENPSLVTLLGRGLRTPASGALDERTSWNGTAVLNFGVTSSFLSRQLVWGAGPRVSIVGQLLSPHHGPSPWALNVARCHPASSSLGIGGGGAGKRQGHSLLPQEPRLTNFFLLSSQEFNPGGKGDLGIYLFNDFSGRALNSRAHLRAGPGPAEASPIISPLGLHLDNTISLPPLWLGLPAPKAPG